MEERFLGSGVGRVVGSLWNYPGLLPLSNPVEEDTGGNGGVSGEETAECGVFRIGWRC